jgi:NADPH-dependent F420 reductase
VGVADTDVRETIGIVGGTGPLGRGLGARWARADHPVHLGSRERERAQAAVDDVRGRVGEGAELVAGTNEDVAAAADLVVVALPYEAQAKAMPALRDAVGTKLVLNVVNPLVFDDRGPRAVPVAAGSAAEECQELLPDATVVSAFHDVSSRRLLRVDEPIVTSVLVCGDDEEANERVVGLAARIEGMRGVRCGPLRNSQHVENLTVVLLSVNRIHGVQAGVIIDPVHPVEATS